MNLCGAPTFFSAVAAVLFAHALLRRSHFLHWSPDMDFLKLFAEDYQSAHLHPHHRHKNSSKNICDDFHERFPRLDGTNDIICVDRRGCCSFSSVQAAVDSINLGLNKRTTIWIDRGIYFEKVIIPSSKPNITLQGQGMETTAIVWNDTANSTGNTFYSASFTVFSSKFVAKNISFMNLAPIPKPGEVGGQAAAIRISGDRAAFWGCGFFGAQDTLHDDIGRHYFRDCFIQGSIDFIFGNGRSLYENCQIISIASPVPEGQQLVDGSVTAHGRTMATDNSGFSFVNCFIGGTGRIWLGRAWKPYARVIFAYSFISDIIVPEGWNDLNDPSRDQLVFFGEYMCRGPGSDSGMRKPFALKLNDTQAAPFLNISYIDGDQWIQSYA